MSDGISRDQHFVPQDYLKNWYDAQGNFAVSVGGKIVYPAHTEAFAHSHWFYGMQELRPDELKALLLYVRELNDKKSANFAFSVFSYHYLARYSRKKNCGELRECMAVCRDIIGLGPRAELLDNLTMMTDAGESDSVDLGRARAQVERAAKLGFDPFHTTIESVAYKFVRRAANGDISFLSEEASRRAFLCYLFDLFSRTPSFLSPKDVPRKFEAFSDEARARILSYVRHLIPRRFAEAFYNDADFRFVLLRNETPTEYITGDQPVVNTGKVEGGIAKSTRLFFPLSPRNAIYFGHVSQLTHIANDILSVIEEDVDGLNNQVCDASVRLIFASNADILRRRNYHARDKYC